MRLEGVSIVLRPRSPWEAADLGVALVRQHAGRIYAAWVLVTLPVCLLLTALGMLIDQVWISTLLMWWLKPIFDRIPLYVLSRAVFGAAPSLRETVRAQWSWGWRAWRWMHWRRLHPGRALLLSVDLLEGLSGAQRSERCSVLSRATGSPSLLVTVIGFHVETMLYFSILLFGIMYLPIDWMSDSLKAMMETLFVHPPLWAQALNNLLYWLAISIMEPFYVGAGFGLYLNRRTQLEAWDIELAFRRLAARLRQSAAAMLVLGATLLVATAPNVQAAVVASDSIAATGRSHETVSSRLAIADDDAESDEPINLEELIESAEKVDAELDLDSEATSEVSGLQEVFSQQYRDDAASFEKSVGTAYTDEDLNPKTTITTWQPRKPEDPAKPAALPAWLKDFAAVIAFLAENGLWILLGLLIIVLIRYASRWLPWIGDRLERVRPLDAVSEHDVLPPEALPDDLPAAVRALWAQAQPRAALALFYRAAVQRLVDTQGTPLPPGATESECLRQARRLEDSDYAGLFARIVRSWQGIAYAQRVPSTADLDALLGDWQRRPEVSA
jgi:hypothetical protein